MRFKGTAIQRPQLIFRVTEWRRSRGGGVITNKISNLPVVIKLTRNVGGSLFLSLVGVPEGSPEGVWESVTGGGGMVVVWLIGY